MKQSTRVLWTGIGLIFFIILMTLLYSTFISRDIRGGGYKNQVIGNGIMDSNTLTLPKFNKIVADGKYKITLKSGPAPGIVISTDENIQKYLSVKVTKGELRLTYANRLNISPTHYINAEIFTPDTPELREIHLSGDTRLTARDLDIPSLILSLAGDSHAILDGHITQCILSLSGKSNVDLSLAKSKILQISSGGDAKLMLEGTTEHLTINNTGAANIEAQNLTAKDVSITGAGQIKMSIRATDKINLKTAGESSLHYFGNPKVINHSVGQTKITKMLQPSGE